MDPRLGLLRLRQGDQPNGTVVGTGFLVRAADEALYGVSCAHVVNAALGRPVGAAADAVGRNVCGELPFLGSRRVSGQVVAWRPPVGPGETRAAPGHDIAVLRLDQDLPGLKLPALRSAPADQVMPTGQTPRFDAFGFMAAEGLPVSGVLRGADAGGWYVAEAEDDVGHFIEEGMSGSPLCSGGMVVGMAVRRFDIQSRQALAIPSLAIAEAFPPLARPYVGLTSFDAETAHLFFGRAARTAELDRLLHAEGRAAVIGASGSGKSSLALAGLAPRRRAADWRIVNFRPSRPTQRPLVNLAEAVLREAGEEAGQARSERAHRLADGISADPSVLESRLSALRAERSSTGVLVVVDQFEELLLAGGKPGPAADEGALLLAELLRLCRPAVDGSPLLHCCLTVRADLLDMVPGRDGVRPFFERPLWLGAMTATESLDAVREPARRFGVEIDSALADGLVDQLDDEPSRLPLLAATLTALWPSIRPGPAAGDWRLPLPAEGAPRIEDGIAGQAEEAVRRLDPADAPDLPRALRRLVRVVGGRPTRRLVRRAEVGAEEWRTLLHLASARLVSLSRQDGGTADGETTAELVHEALLERWTRLRDIVRENGPFLKFRDELDADLRRWLDRDRHPDRLLPESAFAEAERWRAIRSEDLTGDQLAFIAASREGILATRNKALAEARRQAEAAQRRLKRVGAALMAAVLLTALAVGMALEAHDQRAKALRAVDTTLADRAEEALRAGQRERAYLIAAQAARWPDAPGEERRPGDAHVDAVLLLAARNLIAPRVEPGAAFSIDSAGRRAWIVQGTYEPWSVIKAYDIDDQGAPTLRQQRLLGNRLVSSLKSGDVFIGLSQDGRYAWTTTTATPAGVDKPLLILDLDDLSEVNPQWVDPCPSDQSSFSCSAVDLEFLGRSYGSAGSEALVRDTLDRVAFLSLDRRPMLTRVENTIASAYGFLTTSPGHRLMMQASASEVRIWALPQAGGSARNLGFLKRDVEKLSYAPWTSFLDDRSIVALRQNRLSITDTDDPATSVDLGLVGLNGRIFCHAGKFVLIRQSDDLQELYRIAESRAERIDLPADAQVLFHADDHVVEVRNGRHLSLHEGDPMVAPFLDKDIGPDEPDRVLFPAAKDSTLFFLSGQRSIEAWQRPTGRAASRVAIVGEFAPQSRSPRISADGRIIAFSDDDAAGYQIQLTSDLFARRGEPLGDGIVARAEQSLTRCLTSAELEALGISSHAAPPAGAKLEVRPGRHACPSALDADDPSSPGGQGWRRLMRALISAFEG